MLFIDNIEKLTLENNNYRKVIFTSDYSQLVLMSIPVGEDIELEIHPYVDQFLRIEQGQGEIHIGKTKSILKIYKFSENFGIVIPHNNYHRIINTGKIPLKLYTIYSPPEHDKNKLEIFKEKKHNKIIKFLELL